MSPTPTPVRLTSPTDLVRAVPHLLGFRPTDSLVVVGLAGSRSRLRSAVRLDLPPPGRERDAADAVTARLVRAGAAAAVCVVYAEPAAGPFPSSSSPAPPGARWPPCRPLAEVVRAALLDGGLEVRDVLHVARGRWWSYVCTDVACCPPAGSPVGDDRASVLAATTVLAGRVVHADREGLVRSVDRLPGEPTPGLRSALARHVAARSERTARSDRVARSVRGAGRAVLRREIALLGAVRRGGAGDVGGSGGPDGPCGLDDDAVARVAVALTDPRIRDACLRWTVGPHAEAADRVWWALVRRVPPPYAAGPATLLGVSAYGRGEGVLAGACFRRALDDDPAAVLARLALAALESGLPPAEVLRAVGARPSGRPAPAGSPGRGGRRERAGRPARGGTCGGGAVRPGSGQPGSADAPHCPPGIRPGEPVE